MNEEQYRQEIEELYATLLDCKDHLIDILNEKCQIERDCKATIETLTQDRDFYKYAYENMVKQLRNIVGYDN